MSSNRHHYFLLEVTLQSSPIIIKHRFTRQTSDIFQDCMWDYTDSRPFDEEMNVACWNLESREHVGWYGGSLTDFDRIMTRKGFSKTTWLQDFIECYPSLTHTWKRVECCVVRPYKHEICLDVIAPPVYLFWMTPIYSTTLVNRFNGLLSFSITPFKI